MKTHQNLRQREKDCTTPSALREHRRYLKQRLTNKSIGSYEAFNSSWRATEVFLDKNTQLDLYMEPLAPVLVPQ